ncbi:MAG: flavodoxin family protein [Candidatus Natronoplasma sp.]
MDVLVSFYSRTGNTKKTAQSIARMCSNKDLDVKTEEIVDEKVRGGILGFLRGGKDALLKKETEIEDSSHDPAEADVVIVGSPVWAGNITPAVRTYLNRHSDMIEKVSFFCTHGGGDPSNVFETMEDIVEESPEAILSVRDKNVKKNKHLDEVERFVEEISHNVL